MRLREDRRISSVLGVGVSGEFDVNGVTLSPIAKAAWIHHLDGADRAPSTPVS
jgi:outer membrane autotransporter protein